MENDPNLGSIRGLVEANGGGGFGMFGTDMTQRILLRIRPISFLECAILAVLKCQTLEEISKPGKILFSFKSPSLVRYESPKPVFHNSQCVDRYTAGYTL